jgi:hypothetical protein
MFAVVNTDGDATNTLRPTGYCHWFVRRLCISIRGQILEDIQDYSRVHHMFSVFENSETRLNDACEGF